MITSVERAELETAFSILKNAYEHLSWVRGNKQERLANMDAMMILLDAHVMIQETIVSELFSQGDGIR